MGLLIKGTEDIRTIRFPNTVEKANDGAFYCMLSLRSAVLNEGLDEIGAKLCGMLSLGIFAKSGLGRIVISSTLRVIGERALMSCYSLVHIEFCKESKLEIIGNEAFRGTGCR